MSYRSTTRAGLSARRLSQPSVTAAARMTEDEVDAMIDNFAKQDTAREKTWTRIVVERFLSKFLWYFPRRDAKNGPSLSKAYAYYEHITLPRRFVGEHQNADHVLRRAEPGETEGTTELYKALCTPEFALIEFGVGIDLYFSTVKLFAFLLLCAGLINLPNILFYGSSDYSPSGRTGISSFTLRTSAICTTGEWVVCDGCTPEQFSSEEFERFRMTINNTALVLKNACHGGQLAQGMVNYGTGVFLGMTMALLCYYLARREVRFDEDKVTATDYSLVVRNPPPDAYDPDEWQAFFSQFADKQVTVVTVALNNDLLLNKLIARRYHLHNLRLMLPKGTDMEDEDIVRSAVAQLIQDQAAEPPGCLYRFLDCAVFPILRIFNMFLRPDQLVDKAFRLKGEIEELQRKEYQVCSVFVTFETEEGQRAALTALSTGKLDLMSNRVANIAPSAAFRGRLLRVDEATEPSSVRWLDLSASACYKVSARVFNFGVTILIVTLAGIAVGRTRTAFGASVAGPLISIFNSIIPLIVKLLMLFERHTTEGSYQASLYLKVTLFRWVNTAVLTKLITPFTSTISPGSRDVLVQINAIMWSELLITPGLRLLDLWGNVQKHFFAPRSRNQEIMNLNFQGTFYNLGERYTDLTKVLFVCFFYSALFPATFFFGFAILLVQYYADKYCLMRIWSWSPSIGSELAQFSRRYFFSGSVLAYVLVSAYAWAQFPYDNVCVAENATAGVSGIYLYQDGDEIREVAVEEDVPVVFCQQSWRYFEGFPFPPTSRLQPDGLRFMTDSQETLANIYGWTAVAVTVGFVVYFFGAAITRFLLSWFRAVYKPSGQDQNIDFSSNADIYGYVPQIKKGGFAFPFLACNVDQIDPSLIGWRDPSHPYDYHNLIFDVPWEGMPRQKTTDSDESRPPTTYSNATTSKHVFSVIKHYPPAWKLKRALEEHEGSGI